MVVSSFSSSHEGYVVFFSLGRVAAAFGILSQNASVPMHANLQVIQEGQDLKGQGQCSDVIEGFVRIHRRLSCLGFQNILLGLLYSCSDIRDSPKVHN